MKGISEDLTQRLEIFKVKMAGYDQKPVLLEQVLDQRKLRGFDQKNLLKHVANTIIANFSTSKSAEDMLQQVFADFTKPTYTNHKLSAQFSGE
jgi:phospholipase/lecithinase/hemolysin